MTDGARAPALWKRGLDTIHPPSRIRSKTLLLVLLSILFLVAIQLQSLTANNSILQGLLAQAQLILSVALVVAVARAGFWVAVTLNLVQLTLVMGLVLFQHYTSALPGVLISINSILLSLLLHRTFVRLNDQIVDSNLQRQAAVASTDRLNYLAYFDPLTALPNRSSVTHTLRGLCGLPKQADSPFALLMIDLDRFSNFNDVMGHSTGDLILKAVAHKLNGIRHEQDILCRWGEDEFAVIVSRPLTDRQLLKLARDYQAALGAITYRENATVKLSASIGMALYPRDSTDAAELIDYAQTAIRKAKDEGRNNISLFTGSMKAELSRRFTLEQQMMSALDNGELSLVFQPQYRIGTHALRGFEALLRWRSPTLGPVDTGLVIAMAENNGLIFPWSRWVMREACDQLAQHAPLLPADTRLALNISPKQVMHNDFLTDMEQAVREIDLSPDQLELEITESLFIADEEAALDKLARLRDMGFHIALDDFGTGYSSLSLLRRMPIEVLKIDRSFIRDLARDRKAGQVVASLIHLAHQMGVEVIAEGVETEEQLAMLRAIECDSLQGYLWGMPLPLEDWHHPEGSAKA